MAGSRGERGAEHARGAIATAASREGKQVDNRAGRSGRLQKGDLMKTQVLGLLAVVMLAGAVGANAASVIVGSREWRQVTDTVGFSWDQVAAECDPVTGRCAPNYADESTVCSEYEGPCFGGWTWAGNEEIQALFERLIRPDSIQFPTPTSNYEAVQDGDIEAAVGELFYRTGSVVAADIVWGWSRSGPAEGDCRYTPFLESGGEYENTVINDRAFLSSCWSPSTRYEVIGIWFYRSVPESGTLAMLAIGLVGLGLGRRRRVA